MKEDITMTLTQDEKQELFSSIRRLEKDMTEIQTTLKIRLHETPCPFAQKLSVQVEENKTNAADAKRVADSVKNWKEQCEAEERTRRGDWRKVALGIAERLFWAALAAGAAYLKVKAT